MATLEQLEKEEKEAEKLLALGDEETTETTETITEPTVTETKEVAPPQPGTDGVEPLPEVKDKEVIPPTVSEDIWEKKYRTLEGKYKAEVPRLQADNNELKTEIGSLKQKLTELYDKDSNSKSVKASEEIDSDIATLSEYDPRVAEVVKKIKIDSDEKVKALEKKFGKVTEDTSKNVETDINKIKYMRFDNEMVSLGVQDWKTIDQDPGFIEWLSSNVRGTKYTKLQYLQEACRQYDTETASTFFLDYKKELAGAPPAADSQSKLNKSIAPPKGGAGSPPIKAGQSTGLTRESYQKFMLETARGKFNPKLWNGKTEEQVEAMFDQAISKDELE